MRPLRLVLPCYNEVDNLEDVVSLVLACSERRRLTPEQFQLVLVENGSRDESLRWMEARRERPGGDFLRIVPIAINRGYGHGVMAGLRAAGPGILAWSHADQQCDPEDAFRGWELIRDLPPGVLVKGRRHGRALRDWAFSRGFDLVASLTLREAFHEINAQPKVFASELLDVLTDPPDDFAFDLYVLARAMASGYAIREIDVEFPPRKHGVSNWAATFRSKARTIARQVRYMQELRAAAVQGAGR
jgi:glycosyltransferase involved in cell wall biosynthesis